MSMDNLFKALLIIILVAFLYLYYENSNNDRYLYIRPLTESGIYRVYDKKTGNRYIWGRDKIITLNVLKGTQNVLERKF